jgi:glutamate N-acetyltransferase/amino-acid N-acetyltransferase
MEYTLNKSGTVTSPHGFLACGVEARIKSNRKDMALIFSETPAAAAGLFTTNKIQAPPVKLCKENLKQSQTASAIIVNSGNANACTGKQGMLDAKKMASETARSLKIIPDEVMVCSTGTIGRKLPMPRIVKGIKTAASLLSKNPGGMDAAYAIMTTDTVPKHLSISFNVAGRLVTIGGMAKGAGMINPNMATLLVFLTTDAAIKNNDLQYALRQAVEQSFNRISVDNDRSTNDTVLCLANGTSSTQIKRGTKEWEKFCMALNIITRELACKVVRDGEGATKFVTITVKGAASAKCAELATRAIANSFLVKTSWFGADPNWGRVICAIGYSGAKIVPEKIDICYDGIRIVKNGESANYPEKKLHNLLKQNEFKIEVNLNLGKHSYQMYTADCSDEYVHINADYMT